MQTPRVTETRRQGRTTRPTQAQLVKASLIAGVGKNLPRNGQGS